MASRPAWAYQGGQVVRCGFEFTWHGGFAVSQKQKNIDALHQAIRDRFREPALEISTKSREELGRRMSAFVLKLDGVPLECVFQGGKVFAQGGPYTDLLAATPREAKRDPRLHTSGALTAFRYQGRQWPLEPKTAFYDYLYVKAALAAFPAGELAALDRYVWFTDIEFNPQKSINSQARSAALLKAVLFDGAEEALHSPEAWIAYHKDKIHEI